MDMTTEPAKKPLMALGKIPSIALLQEDLGLNTAPVNVKNAFRDVTVQWRKSNIASNSQPATELTDWHSPVVQRDLYTLAENFLADKDNAEHFWSASRPWKYDSKLQYPDDKERIIELLVQLFFKQNRAKKNNAKYGAWAHKDPESNSSREGSTSQRMASMDTTLENDNDKPSKKRPRSETVDNPLSPTSTFIDLSGSFGSSPPLPWDHTLPVPRDIYDMPDEQEQMNRHRDWSHSSTVPSKHGEGEHMGDSGPAKRRAKYSFRARRNPRFSEGISDTEFEELMKEMERAVSSPTPDLPESPQRAPVAPMMENTDGELSSGLPDRNAESSAPSRTQAESAPKAKSGPGSSQMPPPPRASKKTPSPKQKPPKTHRVILKTKSSAASSVASARTHTKAVPTPVPKQPIVEDITRIKIPAMSPSLQADSEAGSLPKDGYQADGLLGATTATKQPTPSHSRAPPTPNHVQPKVQSSSSSVKNTASMEARQISTSQHAGSENNVLTTNHATGPIAPTSSAQGQKTKGKSSPTESASNQRSQPQMQMNFFIVIHEPREKSIFWPEGKIQGTSLSEFIAGVAKVTKRDCIERLDLTLKTSTLEATVPVATDNEASWLVAKKHFTEKLKAARVKAKAKGLDESADPEIYVEPFYGLGGGEVDAEEEGEDEEISFF